MGETTPTYDKLAQRWIAALDQELPAAVKLRKELHANPRVSGEEQDTTHAVASAMELDFKSLATTGGISRIGPQTGPSIALRGELDALPVEEATGVEWASSNTAMHACGHDVHLAALVAVVRAAKRLELPYGLVPFLQPREETYPSGALDIKDSGAFATYGVAHAIGAHVHPDVPLGAVASGEGFINAAAGEFIITVDGQGGHGAYPHKANDVAVCVAHVVSGLSEIVRRTSNPMAPALISVGSVQVGSSAANVLAGKGTIKTTVRTSSSAAAQEIATAVQGFVEHTAQAYGCTGDLEYLPGEPALINDEHLAANFAAVQGKLGLETGEPMRSLGADDFSFYGELVPSLMCFVGVGTGATPSLHDAQFLPPDSAVGYTAKALIAGYLAAARALDVK